MPRAAAAHGAARTYAEARGEYILFMEAADYLDPDAVTLFVKVASCTGADVLTCFLALFDGARTVR